MMLPMGDGPPDGDFARYVEQLTAGSAADAGEQKPASRARSSAVAQARKALAKGDGRKGAPVARRKARPAATLWALCVLGVLLWFFSPRLLPIALILAGGWFAASLVRALAQAARKPS